MQIYLRRIYRERRRLFIFAGAAMISGYLWYQNDDHSWAGLPVSIWVAVSVGLGLTLPAGILAILAPEWRYTLETVGIALLSYSLVMVQLPEYSFMSGQGGLAGFVLFLIAANFIHLLMYGDWSERLLRLKRHSERGVARTSIKSQDAWDLLLPSPNQSVYWDATVTSVRRVDGPAGEVGDTLMVTHLFPDGKTLAQKIRLAEVTSGVSIRYMYSVPAAVNGSEIEQSCAILLEPRGEDLVVHARWARGSYPMRKALMHWIDDWAGRALDTIILRCEMLSAEQREQAEKVKPLVRPKDGKSGI